MEKLEAKQGATREGGEKSIWRSKSGGEPLFRYSAERDRPSTPPQIGLAVAGLFAGIGGIELGLDRAGHRSVLFCENDRGASAVLEARFSGASLHSDVCSMRSLPKETQLLTAGFPCQDLSQAGMTRGISGARSGLVGEVFRLLRRKRVPWVLLENVPFMLNLARGQALSVIINELEDLGYRWAYRVLDSRAFGLPQRRQRVFLLASREHDPRDVLLTDDAGAPESEPDPTKVACGFYWTEGVRGLGWAIDAVPTLKGGSTVGIPSPPAIRMPDGRIIKPELSDAERLQGFRPGWTLPAAEVVRSSFRWKLVGNAVSVDVAEWIGQKLASPGHYDGTYDRSLLTTDRWPRAAWSVGKGRFASSVSEWPKRPRGPLDLARFLQHEGEPLSLKAATGFRLRTESSGLRFPPGFLDAIDAHIASLREPLGHGRSTQARRKEQALSARV